MIHRRRMNMTDTQSLVDLVNKQVANWTVALYEAT